MRASYLLSLALACFAVPAGAVNISFHGQSRDVLRLGGDKSSGLDEIYMAYKASEITEMVISGAAGPVTVQRYSSMGGGFAEDVAVRNDAGNIIVDNPAANMGYIISDGTSPTYIWIADYSTAPFSLTGVEGAADQDCSATMLHVTGTGAEIHYYSIDGRRCELDREIKATYNTLVWEEENSDYVQRQQTAVFSHLSDPLSITPPFYCNTQVTVSGDRFLESWGIGVSLTSPAVIANGVDCHTTAEQTNLPDEEETDEAGSNIIRTETDGLGGSAPADISFKAYTTDAVIHHEWQMASDEAFEYITNRYNQQDLDYTFTEEGTYYIRYVGSNNDGTCETFGDTYTVSIGSSELKIPNAFSPNGDGVNDEWKVAYRSLLSFKCWIFDRYGNELYHFEDPSQGWDGKYRGKQVKSGVYYYVIEAKGADGKKYKKGGDINIIDYKRNGSSTSGGSGATE